LSFSVVNVEAIVGGRALHNEPPPMFDFAAYEGYVAQAVTEDLKNEKATT
jgi:hypothetical protein